MVGATTQACSKQGEEWRLSDCLEDSDLSHDEMKDVVITNIADVAEAQDIPRADIEQSLDDSYNSDDDTDWLFGCK